jgi:hypothetical protein
MSRCSSSAETPAVSPPVVDCPAEPPVAEPEQYSAENPMTEPDQALFWYEANQNALTCLESAHIK